MILVRSTLHVLYVSPSSYMHIDIASSQALELVKPMKAAMQGRKGSSLFWWLNHTKTKPGAQLLKACIPLGAGHSAHVINPLLIGILRGICVAE